MSSVATHQTALVLTRLLRGELSAVDAFDIGMDSLSIDHQDIPSSCRDSHAQRAVLLRQRLQHLGEPSEIDPGLWGAITAILVEGATLLGEKRVVDLLEEGEEHGNKEYLRALADDDLDKETRCWISEHVYPAQMYSHRQMNTLQRSLA